MRRACINRRQILQHAGALGLSSTLLASKVFAAVFMELEQAQKLLLPEAEQFQPVEPVLDSGMLASIAKQSETRVPKNFAPRIWQAVGAGKAMGWVLTDRVIGKYDWIDFAVGFLSDGTATGVEIMAYRESHGSEIRQASWRKQFNGRKGPQSMRFADDIRNISGATLSCQHLTEGVQRLSALVAMLRSKK